MAKDIQPLFDEILERQKQKIYQASVTPCRKCGTLGINGYGYCSNCDEAMQKEKDEIMKLEKENQNIVNSGLPLAVYKAEKGNKELLELVENNKDKSLFIASKSSGLCKTRTLIHVAKSLLKEGVRIKFFIVSALLREIAALFSDDLKEADKLIKNLCRIDLLILDDLGKEKLTDRAGESFFEIIAFRELEKKPTWITSNFSGEVLGQKLGERGDFFKRRIKDSYLIKILDP